MIYPLVKLFSKWFLGLWGKPVIAGKENIPRTGPVVVAVNHISLLLDGAARSGCLAPGSAVAMVGPAGGGLT